MIPDGLTTEVRETELRRQAGQSPENPSGEISVWTPDQRHMHR